MDDTYSRIENKDSWVKNSCLKDLYRKRKMLFNNLVMHYVYLYLILQ